jgi:hypothetical protein
MPDEADHQVIRGADIYRNDATARPTQIPDLVIKKTIPGYMRLTPSPVVQYKRRWLPSLRDFYN